METALETQLAAMAADTDVQRELRLIEAKFSETEMDGLAEFVTMSPNQQKA